MLPCSALPELAEQHIQSEYTASDAEEETPMRELSTEFLINSITVIVQIMDQATDNDPDYEWRPMAWQAVLEMICCYLELLLRENSRKESALEGYITNKLRFTEDPQPGPSSGLVLSLVTFI